MELSLQHLLHQVVVYSVDKLHKHQCNNSLQQEVSSVQQHKHLKPRQLVVYSARIHSNQGHPLEDYSVPSSLQLNKIRPEPVASSEPNQQEQACLALQQLKHQLQVEVCSEQQLRSPRHSEEEDSSEPRLHQRHLQLVDCLAQQLKSLQP